MATMPYAPTFYVVGRLAITAAKRKADCFYMSSGMISLNGYNPGYYRRCMQYTKSKKKRGEECTVDSSSWESFPTARIIIIILEGCVSQHGYLFAALGIHSESTRIRQLSACPCLVPRQR